MLQDANNEPIVLIVDSAIAEEDARAAAKQDDASNLVMSSSASNSAATKSSGEKSSKKPSVDSLFARLRAERESATASANKTMKSAKAVMAAQKATAATVAMSTAAHAESQDVSEAVDLRVNEGPQAFDTTVEAPQEMPSSIGDSSIDLTEITEITDHVSTSSRSEQPEAPREPRKRPSNLVTQARPVVAGFISERDEMTAPLVDRLSRALKRTLQDEQNDLLDRLRAKRNKTNMVSIPVLSDPEIHSAPYRNAAGKDFGGGCERWCEFRQWNASANDWYECGC